VRPFDLGSVEGFLRRASGRVQAVSGICTHQGCRLDLAAARDKLSCPCHGATFTVAGVNLTHPRQSGGPLPALPRLPVREVGGRIEVYAPPPSDQG
jgi:nitrite reductase/ring-hydroxylating ferredoxin subunit